MSGETGTPIFVPDHQGATVRASPNFGDRRDDAEPSLIVLHYTGMATGQAAEDWLCAAQSEVSSHYLVHEDGAIVQMVPETKRAWHAGASFWRGVTDINSASIGIEIVNGGHAFDLPDFPQAQMAAVIALTKAIMERWDIGAESVVGHSDIAPGRKADPGERFDWQALAEAGAGIWTEPVPISGGRFFAPGDAGEPIAALQSMLGLYGFDAHVDGVFGEVTRIQIEAFQRRHRPGRIDGIADMSTIETLNRVLRLYAKLT